MNLNEAGSENYDWNGGVYQLEVTDRVQAGPEGISNLQASVLAKRTRNLHQRTQKVETEKAPLNSPALTGIPTTPTPAPGANTTQVVNAAFVQAAIAALVASSPAALDTLNELAAALGNDANFATTMTNALAGKEPANANIQGHIASQTNPHNTTKAQVGLGNVDNTSDANKPVSTAQQTALNLKANLASPAFSGVPTTPTPAPGTNTTQVVNAAFVQTAIAALVASSPAALDTLNELAAALGNDANFATTITNALAGKVGTGDARLSDQRVPTDLSVTYGKVANNLKTKATVTSAIDLSADGIGAITLSANTAFSFTNFELNKSYLLIITANGFTPSWANGAKHIPVTGNEAFGTSGVFYVNLTCIDATAGSEKLLTTIMKGA